MRPWVGSALDWARDLPTWPLSHLSRRVTGPVHQWHIQEAGAGPCVLLLHGSGASTHTWRALIPRLALDYHVVALDLPGQGFTRLGARHRCGLPQMSADIAQLCQAEGWEPAVVIGHSAGGAIALCLTELLPGSPRIIGINAALGQFDGIASWLFPLMAKLLATTPLTALAFSAGRAPEARARRLIQGTGSTLDVEGVGYYARLIADRTHVDGTLKMMAQWSVSPLLERLDRIRNTCLFITGDHDRAVSPDVSANAARRMRRATHLRQSGLGHLAHEEDPEAVLGAILDWLASERESGLD